MRHHLIYLGCGGKGSSHHHHQKTGAQCMSRQLPLCPGKSKVRGVEVGTFLSASLPSRGLAELRTVSPEVLVALLGLGCSGVRQGPHHLQSAQTLLPLAIASRISRSLLSLPPYHCKAQPGISRQFLSVTITLQREIQMGF